MAAETAAQAGARVTLCDAMPSVGRKLLMAGKSGLNLTRDEPLPQFIARYSHLPEEWREILRKFDPLAVQDWARGLGQELFTGSTGRVFPVAMKASPLLRAWLARLDRLGVERRVRWRWTGWDSPAARFDTPGGPAGIAAGATVLALGGASWSRLGSDGAWAGLLEREGVPLAPFRASNAGLKVAWSPHMARHFGAAVKGVRLTAGPLSSRGELAVSARGLEGGGLYEVFAAVRDGAPLFVDLLPDRDAAWIAARLAGARRGDSLASLLRKRLGLDPVRAALWREFTPAPERARLGETLKAVTIAHEGPRPIDEAISTAGGVTGEAVDGSLMLKARPGVFAAGEMLDWDAPTGGYLLTACLAQGRHAGAAAARWAQAATSRAAR